MTSTQALPASGFNASTILRDDFGEEAPVELPGGFGAQSHPQGVVARSMAVAMVGGESKSGTSCSCVCGDRVIWRQMLFEGNLVVEKEAECEHEICPSVNIPGLRVQAKCDLIEDITELSAGTVCYCQCGDRAVWRNAAFKGDVEDKMRQRCLEDICPRVQPIPGYRFEGECRYDKYLFINSDMGTVYGQRRVQAPVREKEPARSSADRAQALFVGLGAAAAMLA